MNKVSGTTQGENRIFLSRGMKKRFFRTDLVFFVNSAFRSTQRLVKFSVFGEFSVTINSALIFSKLIIISQTLWMVKVVIFSEDNVTLKHSS